ncbi:hypothetical protein ACLKA6_016513 [Drosophila palustris]
MTEHNESPMTESHWLNWCRLCAKDDLRGNVKVCTSENANNTWNSDLVMAIRKYFDVHMRLEDELSGVLCKECYTLISELIDFAEHVNKVQAIFEILRRSEPSDHLNVEALRQQYGLREGDWTHIIKPVLDIENNVAKKDLTGVPKQEFVDLGEKHLRNVCRKSEDIRTETDDLDSSPKRRKRKKLVCKWCDKVYHNPTSYQKHLRKVCRKVERKVDQNAYCELCNKTLSSLSALKLHMEGMHKDFKRFICDHCGKQLKTITALSEHKLVHTDDRPFVCAVCSTGFKNKARLRVHSKTHEKPNYECNICGKKLQTRRTWNMHKVVHSEDRKFKCDVCDALFKRSKTLKRHLLTHTGLRPFACNYCEQAFRCNSNLRIHKLHRHPHEFKKGEDGVLPSRVRIPTLDELPVMSKLKTEP